MRTRKVIVHTDLLIGHLTGERNPSLLRVAMGEVLCYTTVFHAMLVFAWARSPRARRAAEDMFAAIRVLGVNARSAPLFGELLASDRKRDVMNVLIAGICKESRLPLLTERTTDFARFRGLEVLPAAHTLRRASAAKTS
jgi:predicted nucleic acid-binding protein